MMNLLKIFFLTAVVQICLGPASWALGPVIFGPEFTFFDPNISDRGMFFDKLDARLRQHLIEDQPEGAKFTSGPSGSFESPNGWAFQIKHDVGVGEVTVSPGTVEFFRRYKADMQDAIFVSAANEGFFPALFQGGGHLNLGTSAFEGNDLLLRNFIVDVMINHNELFLGILSYDSHNAGSFSILTETTQLAVYEVIKRFDQGELAGPSVQSEFMHQLEVILFNSADDSLQKWRNYFTPSIRNKYVAVNFGHVSNIGDPNSRIEIRGVRPQASMDVWVRQIDLIYNRLLYLEKIKIPIPIRWQISVSKPDFVIRETHLNPPVYAQDALRAFYSFVTESGLRWQDHNDYLWPKWISDGDVAKFEQSPWFKAQEENLSRDQVRAARIGTQGFFPPLATCPDIFVPEVAQ